MKEQVWKGGMPTGRQRGLNPEPFGLESNTLTTHVLYTFLPARLGRDFFFMFEEQTDCCTVPAHFCPTGLREVEEDEDEKKMEEA